MIIDKQQEALLFTLTFDQLDRLYGGVELTPLEKELFSRCKLLDGKIEEAKDICFDFDVCFDTLDYDLRQKDAKIKDLEIDIENKNDELLDKTEEINNLKWEIEQLKATIEEALNVK